MKILEFFFDSLWHFVGLCVVIGITLSGLADVLRAMRCGR